MRSLGAAKPAQRLRVRRGPVVERDVIVSAFLVRFHFESVEELLKMSASQTNRDDGEAPRRSFYYEGMCVWGGEMKF